MAQCQELLEEEEEKHLNRNMAMLIINRDERPTLTVFDSRTADSALHEMKDALGQKQSMDEQDTKTCMETDVDLILEAGPNKNFRDCQKNPGHVDFIPVSELTLSHLPEDYRNQTLLEMIRCYAELTVCLKVGGSSPDRPLDFPFSGSKYRNWGHIGTGHISECKRGEGSCPCEICMASGKPVRNWYLVSLMTASHVVFDEAEMKKTRCYLDYNSDETDLKSCPLLTNAFNILSAKDWDASFIRYGMHDMTMGEMLEKKLFKLGCALHDVWQLYFPPRTDISFAEQWARLQERCSSLVSELELIEGKVKSVVEENNSQGSNLDLDNSQSSKLTNNTKLISKDDMNLMLAGASRDHLQARSALDFITDKILHREYLEDTLQRRELCVISMFVAATERELKRLRYVLDKDCNVTSEPLCDPSHPFTIIVSHPHGCGKRITFGQICEEMEKNSLTCSFSYDNPTCPGSSGSYVLILGNTSNGWPLVHSGGRKHKVWQTNESSVTANF